MTGPRLSALYGTHIDVIRVHDRIIVVGGEDAAGHHHLPPVTTSTPPGPHPAARSADEHLASGGSFASIAFGAFALC